MLAGTALSRVCVHRNVSDELSPVGLGKTFVRGVLIAGTGCGCTAGRTARNRRPFRQTKALGHHHSGRGLFAHTGRSSLPAGLPQTSRGVPEHAAGLCLHGAFSLLRFAVQPPRDKGNRKGRFAWRPPQVKRALVPAHRKPRLWQNTPARKANLREKRLLPGRANATPCGTPFRSRAARSREDRPPRTCHSPCSSIL